MTGQRVAPGESLGPGPLVLHTAGVGLVVPGTSGLLMLWALGDGAIPGAEHRRVPEPGPVSPLGVGAEKPVSGGGHLGPRRFYRFTVFSFTLMMACWKGLQNSSRAVTPKEELRARAKAQAHVGQSLDWNPARSLPGTQRCLEV